MATPPPSSHTKLRAADDGAQSDTIALQPEVRTYLGYNAAALLAGGLLALTTSSILKDMAAGATASICTMLLGYPLDTAKTRMQIGQKTIGEDGFIGLYKGLGIGLLREASTAAIYIATCGFLKLYLVPADAAANLSTLLLFLFIGASACLVSCTTRVPLEIVSKQIQSGKCQTLPEAAQKVFAGADGCSTVERSWVAVMLREVPYGAFQIAFFELAKLMLGFLGEWGVPIFFQRMAWGAVAGSGAAFLTTPFDVITSRVMLSSAPAVEDGAIDKPPSVWGTVQLMLQQEGPGVFFTGSLLRAAFYSPGTCIFFSVYETVAAALK
eukprot:EG_transcript_14076